MFAPRVLVRPFVSLLLFSSILVSLGGRARAADEGADWGALNALRAQLGDTSKDPADAVKQLQAFYTSRKLVPVVGAEVVCQVAEITRGPMGKPDQAMKILDAALQEAKAHAEPGVPVEVMFLEGEAATLQSGNKTADAVKLLQSNFKTVEAAGRASHTNLQAYASRCLYRLDDAQTALRGADAKPDETIQLLESSLERMPVFLDPERQRTPTWGQGWMYERLMNALVAQGKTSEALSWGKLMFAETSYDQNAIGDAIKKISGVWAKSNDLASLRAFAAAQAEGADPAANPLAKVPFPSFDTSFAKTQLKGFQDERALGPWRGQVAPIISLQIALQQWRPALENAQSLITDDPSAPDGPQQVARVLKAKDASIVRANAFLAYLNNAKLPNPLPDFLKEADAQAKTGDVKAGSNN